MISIFTGMHLMQRTVFLAFQPGRAILVTAGVKQYALRSSNT